LYHDELTKASEVGYRSNKSTKNNHRKITIEDINPELAAQIVRHHILPMFENKSN